MPRPPIEPESERVAAALRRVQTLPAVSNADVAVLLSVGQQTVINSVESGELPFEAIKVGQRWVFPSLPLRKFLGLTAAAADTPAPAA